jgi:4-aminobutyrate aminotransferase-like enzyme
MTDKAEVQTVQSVPRSDNLRSAVAAATEMFRAANPKSLAQHSAAAVVMPGGNTRTVLYHEPFPLTIARGDGCRLWDLDGHEYVDMLGEFTAGIFGPTNQVIRSAVISALDRGIDLSGHTVAEAELARVICDRFPSIAHCDDVGGCRRVDERVHSRRRRSAQRPRRRTAASAERRR